MTDQATAPAGFEPTAIEPERVLILNEAEQRLIFEALLSHVFAPSNAVKPLLGRIGLGDEYVNETDELTRVTLRKRRLEAEVRRCNKRIADLEPDLAEGLVQEGLTGVKHAATGASLVVKQQVWVKLELDRDASDQEKQIHKARVGAALLETADRDLVREDFNLNSLSAAYRERFNALLDEQRQLPEHERQPIDLDRLIPEPLKGLIRIDNSPRIEVRAAS